MHWPQSVRLPSGPEHSQPAVAFVYLQGCALTVCGRAAKNVFKSEGNA